MAPETRIFATAAEVPRIHEWLAAAGIEVAPSPLNASGLLALLSLGASWLFLFRSAPGFELRVFGRSPRAALYAGIAPARVTMLAMCLSGALAGLVGVNEILGVQHRLLLNASAGYGFAGIAVALIGRNPPARDRAREPSLRHALPGRRRARLRGAPACPARWSRWCRGS